jgi:hypothetical protein
LQTQVDILDSEVADLQEQITNLGASTSEVSVYELMTNDPGSKYVWQATSGVASNSLSYVVNISSNVVSLFPAQQPVSFYNPETQSWFYGTVTFATYNGSSTALQINFIDSNNYQAGCSWQDTNISFPIYKGNFSTSNYNFTNTLILSNENYWKNSDATHKYWSKIKASFVINEPTTVGTGAIRPFSIKNVENDKLITLRDVPCGCVVDLELSFEKQYISAESEYNCVTLIDCKYNTSTNIALSEDSELLFGGYSGFNPKFGYGLDLQWSTGSLDVSIDNNESVVSVQDVNNSIGNNNSNRIFSRKATGPNYTAPFDSNFFTGGVEETIIFNFSNLNITLFNIEQSFGKMSVV